MKELWNEHTWLGRMTIVPLVAITLPIMFIVIIPAYLLDKITRPLDLPAKKLKVKIAKLFSKQVTCIHDIPEIWCDRCKEANHD